MKKFEIILVCSITLLVIFNLEAQIKSLRVSLRTDASSKIDEFSQQNIEKLISQSEQIISAYNDKASMYDLDKNKVTAESINDFKNLFHGGAYLFNDLVQFGRRIPMNEYTSFVSDYLRDEGVNFKISNLLLKSAVKNPASDNQYEIVVKVIKLLTKVYDKEKKKFIEYPKYKQVHLEFIITIQGEDLDQTQIYGIDGQIENPPPPKEKELHVFGAYSYGLPSFKIHDQYSSNNLKFDQKQGFDIGVKFALGISRSKKSKILAGLSYGNLNYSIVSDSMIEKIEDTNNNKEIAISTLRVMENVVANKINFSYLQARFGMQAYLLKGFRQVEWGIAFELLPTYLLSGGQSSKGQAKKYTTYSYRSFVESCQDENIEVNESTDDSGKILLGAEVKSFVQYYLGGRKSAISAGFSYRRYLDNWLGSPVLISELLPHNFAIELSFIKKLN